MSRTTRRAIDRAIGAVAAKVTPLVSDKLGPVVISELNKFNDRLRDEITHRLDGLDHQVLIYVIEHSNDVKSLIAALSQAGMLEASGIRDHHRINWFHSIDLGNGAVTNGRKSADLLEDEFNRLQLSEKTLSGKRVLDIGCNDGFFSLKCEKLGAVVTSIDGIFTDGLKYVRRHVSSKFNFYCMDLMSPSFYEIGHFDIILCLGVLYHSMFPYEQLVRIASACAPDAMVYLETEYYNLPGLENNATIFFDYENKLSADWTSPVFPSIAWIEQTLSRLGFQHVTLLDRSPGVDERRGRVTIRAQYGDRASSPRPFLYAAEQI